MRQPFCLLLLILLAACSSNVKDKREGTHTEHGNYIEYTDSTTGWTTRYPKHWNSLTATQIAALEGRGQELMEDVTGSPIELVHKNLLWLKKNDLNTMTSNYELFNASQDGSFAEYENVLVETISAAYEQNGLQFDVNHSKTILDGLEFSTYETILYSADRNDTIMTQLMWHRLIGNRVAMLMNINYNNPADRDTLMNIIKASKFSIRD